MFNLAVAITAALYGYVTGDLWPALLGGALLLLALLGEWLLSVLATAAISVLVLYFFWTVLFPELASGEVYEQLAVSVLYLGTVFARAIGSFR